MLVFAWTVQIFLVLVNYTGNKEGNNGENEETGCIRLS